MAALVVILAGCTSNGSPQPAASQTSGGGLVSRGASGPDTPASPTATTDPTTEREDQVVARAKALAEQYDYDQAVTLLRPLTSPAATAARAEILAENASAAAWKDNSTISHLFYHSLIVDPRRAFHSRTGQGYRDYMVTMDEFTSQLQALYDRGYVLVHPQRIAAPDADGVMTYQEIRLPPGKIPLVLSVDDVSYYEYMEGDGFASDLFVAADGRVRNHYTDADGVTHEGSYDVVPVIDDFVQEHPDFSYRGDKGTIALTGYNGVLGYRSSIHKYGDTADTRAAIRAATVVADAMKADGWNFASHSWGHINMTESSLSRIERDASRWDHEVRPIVGPTEELIFAFGADIAGLEKYGSGNAKYAFLRSEGFRYFFPIDASTPHWMQLSHGSMRQARINVDGITMGRLAAGKKSVLPDFFGPTMAVDPLR